MRPHIKVILAGLLLLTGISAALPYRRQNHDAARKRIPNQNVTKSPNIRYQRDVKLQVSSQAEKSDPKDAIRQTSSSNSVTFLPEIRSQNPFTQQSATPRLSPTYSPFNNFSKNDPREHSSNEPLQNRESQNQNESASSELQGKSRDSVPIEPIPPQKHKILDGDTLEILAQRYLGSKDRYLEIFTENINVLSSPDQLPIGMMITIPARTSQLSSALKQPLLQDDKSRKDAPRTHRQRALVPVPASSRDE